MGEKNEKKPSLTEFLDKYEIWYRKVSAGKIMFRLYGEIYVYHIDEGRVHCKTTNKYELIPLKDFVNKLFTERKQFRQKPVQSTYWTKSAK